jgi:hypothetical protein
MPAIHSEYLHFEGINQRLKIALWNQAAPRVVRLAFSQMQNLTVHHSTSPFSHSYQYQAPIDYIQQLLIDHLGL